MKILVLNGSPKREHSDTMRITRTFLDGMNGAAPQTVHTILTVPESPMFNAPEAAVVTVPRLALVKKAGAQYAETGGIDAALLADIFSPMIPEEQYAAVANSGV